MEITTDQQKIIELFVSTLTPGAAPAELRNATPSSEKIPILILGSETQDDTYTSELGKD